MRLAVLFEDGEVWISMSPEEFTGLLTKKLGDQVQPAMEEVIAELKKKALHA